MPRPDFRAGAYPTVCKTGHIYIYMNQRSLLFGGLVPRATGCGNSLNAGDPLTMQLIMDSLRYWLTEMRVDGFRFDLAPTLARQDGEFEQRSAFFDLVAQDPVVSRAKLVAEPWDVGQM